MFEHMFFAYREVPYKLMARNVSSSRRSETMRPNLCITVSINQRAPYAIARPCELLKPMREVDYLISMHECRIKLKVTLS